jgi:periplasmic copper chaperone A
MHRIHRARPVRRFAAAAALTTVASALLWSGAASAHISPQDPEGPSGGYMTTAFKVGHGCEGSPTTKVEIQMAEGVTSVKPQPVPGWNLSTTMRTLDPPIDNHGTKITETVDTVVWEGGALPDSELQMFWVSMKLPEGEAGEALAFPVVQTCEVGQTDWIEPIVEGQEEPAHPAPVITLTAGAEDGHGAAADTTTTVVETEEASVTVADGEDDSSSSNGLAIGGLVLGALGLLTGGVALARSGKRA